MILYASRHQFLRTLIVLTIMFVATQVLFLTLNQYITGILDIARSALSTKLFFSASVIPPLLQMIIAQLMLYVFLVYILWYATISVAELFSLSARDRHFLAIFLWINSAVLILSFNTYFVPHSVFTIMIRHHLFADALTSANIKTIMIISSLISLTAFVLVLMNMVVNFYRNQHIVRNSLMLFFMIILACFIKGFSGPHKIISVATIAKPNIIIIGFDAIRPDHISFFSKDAKPTPRFDRFLRSATVFTEAYTPVARTLPAWASILSSSYPVHTAFRENSILFKTTKLTETLPKVLHHAGYETIYATDDRRFNNVDKPFGFDYIVGPQGTVADYLISSINDLPLSNLIIPTPLGEFLFPYNYANRASAHTFDPSNFLEQIDDRLQGATHRPVFLAVHFTLSGWPFYWYNDSLDYRADAHQDYENGVLGSDELLAQFLTLLKKRGLLDHAVVVLLSDHGITMALHGDRVIKEKNYQGDKTQMKVRRTRYADAEELPINPSQLPKNEEGKYRLLFGKNTENIFNIKNYGIDTSSGYGGDLLSLKQNRVLFAIKGFGLNIGRPHTVSGRATLLDLAPTLLQLLRLPAMKHSDGVSLRPYLFNARLKLSNDRPIFLESAFSIMEIEQQDIVIAEVVKKSLAYFYINPDTGLVTLYPKLVDLLVNNKQRAILLGDWLLVYYPISERFQFIRIVKDGKPTDDYMVGRRMAPPYFVLVNLKTGKWTTEIDNPLVENSPMLTLKNALKDFYGSEMRIYANL